MSRPSRVLAALATAATLGITLSVATGEAATNPSGTVAVDCTNSFTSDHTAQDVTFRVSAPDTVESGAAATFTIDPVQTTLPAEASGATVDDYRDITTRVDVTGATLNGATITSPGDLPGSAPAEVTTSGTTVVIRIPGPIAGGTTITTPGVAIDAAVTAPTGGTAGLAPASPFYTLKANVGVSVSVTCTATNPSQGTATAAVGGADTTGPSITIASPYDGAIYGYQQAVTASYSCADPSGVASCTGTVAVGGPVDTATEGGKTFTVSAADQHGNTTTRTVQYLVLPPGVEPPPPPTYVPLVPGRLLDTRPGTSTVDGADVGAGPTTTGRVVELQVAGRHGVPADALAAVLNVTATDTQGWGYVTVWPCGQTRPNASSVNYTEAGDTRPNAVVTELGAGGRVCLAADGAGSQLIVDLDGYFPPGAAYTPLNPGRVLDTRPGGQTADGQASGAGATASGTTIELTLAGRHGIPADAGAVVLNVTATDTTGWGYVTVWPCDEDRPNASNLNYTAAGQTTPNAVFTTLDPQGRTCLFTDRAGAQLIADVVGWFPASSAYTGLSPARLLDTRPGGQTVDGASAGSGLPPAGTEVRVQVAGRHGVPPDAVAAVLNVTATGTTGWGYVTVWPCGADRPVASSLNYTAADQTRPNAVVTELGEDGTVCLTAEPATTHLLVDVAGYLASPQGPDVPPYQPGDPTDPTTPPTTDPGDPEPEPEAPEACGLYLTQPLAQAAHDILAILAPVAATALDPNGNGIACEDYPFLV